MPFIVPNFNILCNLWRGAGPGQIPFAAPVGTPDDSNVPCALVYGRRVNVASTGGTGVPGVPLVAMNLLTAKGTDIRGYQDAVTGPDWVEVPAMSGRFYGCFTVDDIGKGYANEHRTAMIYAIPGTWTPPYA